MPVNALSRKWVRHYVSGSNTRTAFVVTHGSYKDSYGFTRPAPASLNFYTFHTDTLYTVEIDQIIAYQSRLDFDGVIEHCPAKEPVAILGRGSSCWNYWLSAWNQNRTETFVLDWKKNPRGDLLMLVPGTNSYLDALFEALNAAALDYDMIHFCACRASGSKEVRSNPKDAKELYMRRNPYWR